MQAKPHYRTLDVGLTVTKLLWCVHRGYAIEFLSWVPLPNDPDRLRFARLLLEQPQPHRAALWPHVREAAQIVRGVLKKHGMDAIALAEGVEGIALWIPLADAPHAAAVRTWLHAIAAEAVAAAREWSSRYPRSFVAAELARLERLVPPSVGEVLTLRQREIVDLLRSGASIDEVAAAVGASRNTVRVHISRIHRRLGVRNRAQLLARVSGF